MARFSSEWQEAISQLLGRHGLSARAAEVASGGKVSHTYITDWARHGRVPERRDKALGLLAADIFSREEAIVCLRAGGFEIPEDWREAEQTRDVVEAIDFALRNVSLSDAGKEQIKDFVAKVKKQYPEKKDDPT